ncbi:MAG TPA: hypothetical protein VJ716_04605 [Gaiellaceae bacterium]|nr:hypothetical protein [Gaiellaceae bacterium]
MTEGKKFDRDDLPPEALELLDAMAKQLGLTSGRIRLRFEDGEAKSGLVVPSDESELPPPDVDPPNPN